MPRATDAEKHFVNVPDFGVGLGGCRGDGLFDSFWSGTRLMTSLA